MEKYRGFLIDLDGVLVKADSFEPFSGAIRLITLLKEKKIPFLIATSNSKFSPEEISDRMKKKGFSVSPEDILSPLSVAPEYLKSAGIENIFVIGSQNLKDYLSKRDLKIKNDENVDCVLIGLDKEINFEKLKIATTALKRNKAKLYALNGNLISQDSDGRLFPGVGSIAYMLSYACSYDKNFKHFGKMSDIYNETAFNRLGVKQKDILMISDDLFVDLKGYKSLGLDTAFVTTGKYTEEDIKDFKPDYTFHSLDELIEKLEIERW